MSEQFKLLFTPLKIGPITIRNRITYTPVGDAFEEIVQDEQLRKWKMPGERLAYYHAEKAKGGVGLTEISGAFSYRQHESDYIMGGQAFIDGYNPAIIPGLKKISDMVHQYGGKIGMEIMSLGIWFGETPSPIPDFLNHVVGRAPDYEEIAWQIDQYGKTAKNIMDGGFDAVTIHGSHGFGINGWLDPLYNRRTDKYGGSLENRMRYLLEVIDEVREYCGNKIALGMRMNCDSLAPDGNTPKDAQKMVEILEDQGKLDYIHADLGLEMQQFYISTPPLYVPPGYQVHLAAALKEVAKKIVIGTVGRIHDPVLAEKILEDGKADFIGMTRGLIADPELPNKAKEGRVDEIRPCIADLEGCLAERYLYSMTCTVNPACGREKELGVATITRAPRKKKVLIVGAGPAGLECARTAAMRGHEVQLYDRDSEIGGRVKLAAMIPGREELLNLIRYYDIMMKKFRVKVVLKTEVTPVLIEKIEPDAVVLCTGANWMRNGLQSFDWHEIPGWQNKNVTTVDDILTGKVKPGKKAVIIDEVGYVEGAGLAEWLADRDVDVELVTRQMFAAIKTASSLNMPYIYARIYPKGVKVSNTTWVKEIHEDKVKVYFLFTGDERIIEGVDTVVLITGKTPDDTLYRQLKGKVKELHLAGDGSYAVGSGGMCHAVREGYLVARQL